MDTKINGSFKSIIYALVANLCIAIAKFVAAFLTGSGSMLAEGIHSLADCGNQTLLIIGLNKSKRPPTMEHPLGYGKEIYFYSFLVALLLFSVGGVYSIYEGIHKWHSTEPIKKPLIAIGVLLFSIIAEGAALYGVIKTIKPNLRGRSYYKWFKETRRSELLVVFGEDFAALIGLSFALIAISISAYTGNPIYDAIGSIGIGVLLIIVAIFIAIEIKALLVGQGVDKHVLENYKDFLNSQNSVEEIYSVLTLQMGEDVMVAIKARMIIYPSNADLIDAINGCESNMKESFPEIQWIFFEPDHQV